MHDRRWKAKGSVRLNLLKVSRDPPWGLVRITNEVCLRVTASIWYATLYLEHHRPSQSMTVPDVWDFAIGWAGVLVCRRAFGIC